MMVPAMAGEAGDVLLAVREIGVDFAGHDDHLARDFFFRLFVAGEVALHVTHIALGAQGDTEGSHGGSYFFRFQELQILGRTLFLRFRILRKKGDGDDEKRYRYSHLPILHFVGAGHARLSFLSRIRDLISWLGQAEFPIKLAIQLCREVQID
jgi:hypothetical protein